MANKIYLKYNSNYSFDGLGAQLQRILTTKALCKKYRFNFLNSSISNIQIHPLDGITTPKDYNIFIKKINSKFDLFDEDLSTRFSIETNSLTIRALIKSICLVFWNNQSVVVNFLEPYPISNFIKLAHSDFDIDSEFFKSKVSRKYKNSIVIHFRSGMGNFAIYPGQKIPRELPTKYFLNILKMIPGSLSNEIIILTDAPRTYLEFSPPKNQLHLWKNYPGFERGKASIKPAKLSEAFKDYNVSIISGGSALIALEIMASAKYLVMSRSSLSYVGAVLNQSNNIYFPPNFWHPKIKGWKYIKSKNF